MVASKEHCAWQAPLIEMSYSYHTTIIQLSYNYQVVDLQGSITIRAAGSAKTRYAI